jgi:hypothetical protein
MSSEAQTRLPWTAEVSTRVPATFWPPFGQLSVFRSTDSIIGWQWGMTELSCRSSLALTLDGLPLTLELPSAALAACRRTPFSLTWCKSMARNAGTW